MIGVSGAGLLGLVLASSTAHATVPDLFGIGARWQGAGGGGVAVVEDGSAAFVNPAGLSRVRRPTAAIGYVQGWPRFAPVPALYWDTNRDGLVDDRDTPLQFDANPAPMGGFQVQASRNVGGKFGVGLTAYVPTRNLIRFAMFEPSLPNYIMYDNRPQRFVAAAAVGGKILPGLSIGLGVDLLAQAKISVAATIDVELSAPETTTGTGLDELVTGVVVDTHEIDFAVVPAMAPLAGIQLDLGELVPALDGLVLGASYHHSVGLPIDVDLDIQANLGASGIGDLDPYVTAAVAKANLALFDHYVPPRLNFGLAWRRANALTIYADGRFTDWRGLVLNVARVSSADLSSPLVDLDDAIEDGNPYSITVRSTLGLRMGADLHLPEFPVSGKLRYVRLSFRGGFGWEPTPLVSQGPESAFLDADRTFFTLGAGLEHWDAFELVDGAIRWDLFFQWHVLSKAVLPRTASEPTAGFPVSGAGIPAGGTMPVIGGQWSFEY